MMPPGEIWRDLCVPVSENNLYRKPGFRESDLAEAQFPVYRILGNPICTTIYSLKPHM